MTDSLERTDADLVVPPNAGERPPSEGPPSEASPSEGQSAASGSVEITAPTLEAPVQRIGRYEVLGHLASGGMAEVVLARLVGPSRFERPVVIKRILPQLAKEPAFVSMFLDEARLAARIRHPNVVQVTELGANEGELFLVMEYLEGESLAGLLRRLVTRHERLSPLLAAHIVAEAANGLHAAHELRDEEGRVEGVVHRDVSPQNIFVGYDGTVKVLDFGVAKAADRLTQTEAGQLKGKIEYMSPEQAQGRPLDRRSDVFALGVVLYEAATNRRLFKRDNKLLALKAVSEANVRPPSAIAPELTPALDAVVMRALARPLDQRYPSAATYRRDLVALVQTRTDPQPPDVELSALMQRLFAERIQEKRDMLRRVSAGSHLTHVPQAEVDVAVDLGAVDSQPDDTQLEAIETVTSSGHTPTIPIGPSASTSGARIALAMLAGATVVGVAAVLMRGVMGEAPPPPETVRAPAAIAPPTPLAPSIPPRATEQEPVPPTVVLTVETIPEGAVVSLDGTPRGSTPLQLELPRGLERHALAIDHEGYQHLDEAVVPSETQRLRLPLVPLPAPRRPPRTTRETPRETATEPETPFHRFD